jgi:DNA polymerase-3 subunit gamma/tau
VPAPPRAGAPRDAEPPPWVTDDVPDEALADAGDPGPMAGDGVDDDPRSAFSAPSAAATASSPAAAPPASAALQPTALGEAWADRLRPLITAGSITALVRELAVQAQAVDRQPLPAGGERWLVQVERETLRAPALRDKLVAAIAQAGGPVIELEVQAGVVTDSIARRDAAAREAAQREAEALILGDPAVQTLMGQFRTARIVPGSIQPIAPGNGA